MLGFDLAVLLLFWQRDLPDWSFDAVLWTWARTLARGEG
jgi:hypothetical protein